MADLYSRLREIRDRRARGAQSTGDAASPPPGPADPLRSLSPGPEWREVAHGVFTRTASLPLPYGAEQFDGDGRWRSLSPLARVSANPTPLFIDIETSGRSGGAGSVAFLIGVGRVTAGTDTCEVAVTQLFLTDFASEADQLDELDRLLSTSPRADGAATVATAQHGAGKGARDRVLYVTYNGAGFDLPVLRSRHIMHRRRFREAEHFDLLHPTRRLFAPVIGSCTLSAVERSVLGVGREADIPGIEVPGRYQAFLKSGDTSAIGDVIAHHHYDVAHLALLGVRVNAILLGVDDHRPAPDRLALAALLLRGGDAYEDRAVRLLDDEILETQRRRGEIERLARRGGFAARLASSPPKSWGAARELRARLARRRGENGRLLELRRELFRVRCERDDVVELAKVLEHRERDYAAAIDLIMEWGQGRSLDDELTHRVARLRRKARRTLSGRSDTAPRTPRRSGAS
ncbi:MAG: ribonuclease H-like domain-containing protein [Spirochaetales bacterium]|nr:ribonuclease H-like domain-containing protein [Spirochaetales bacterium]